MLFDAYYTWGKALAYGAADSTVSFAETSIQDPMDLAGSYGPKQGDTRHRFVGLYSVAIPSGSLGSSGIGKAIFGDWNLQGILSARSGLPINVTAGRDMYGNGRQDGQRPDLVSTASPYASLDPSLRYLNLAAFDVAAPTA
jgi:hypothetical protein